MSPIASPGRVPRGSSPAAAPPGATKPDGTDADQAEVAQSDADVRSLAALLAADRALRERQQIAMDRRREEFDFMMEQRAELERERNALQSLAMEARKHDDELLKEWIRLA